MTSEEEIDDQVPCPECAALNPPDAKFCADCGCMFVKKAAGKPPPLPKAARRGAATKTDAVEKSRARQEFGRIKNIVLTIRFVYWSSSILAALHIIMWHTVLDKLVTWASGDWYLPVTALVYGQFALMVAGALLMLRAPLVWATIGACNWTLNTVLQWWLIFKCIEINAVFANNPILREEQIEVGMMVVFVGFWTLMLIAFWFAVGQAARVQRLMAENPELSIVRKRFDPNRRVEGGVAEHARTRRRKDSGEVWKGRLKIAGMAAGLLVVVITAIWFLTRPPTVDATLEKFVSRWGRSDADGIQEMLAGGAIREDIDRRGWLGALPGLGEQELDSGTDRATAEFSCGNGKLSASFTRSDSGWSLTSVKLPPIEPGPLQPALDAFRAAWNAEGTDALIELFRPAKRESHRRALNAIFKRRGWDQQRPKLGGVDPGKINKGRVRVLFGLKFDEVSVTFDYWHPQWYVVALRPPS